MDIADASGAGLRFTMFFSDMHLLVTCVFTYAHVQLVRERMQRMLVSSCIHE